MQNKPLELAMTLSITNLKLSVVNIKTNKNVRFEFDDIYSHASKFSLEREAYRLAKQFTNNRIDLGKQPRLVFIGRSLVLTMSLLGNTEKELTSRVVDVMKSPRKMFNGSELIDDQHFDNALNYSAKYVTGAELVLEMSCDANSAAINELA